MAKTKNQIARKMYGETFEYLSGAQKAVVTRTFNNQDNEVSAPVSRATEVVAEIGRVGVNGCKKCILPANATISQLLDQSGLAMDTKKETVNARSTGHSVSLSDAVKAGEVYIITPAIKSA